MKILTSEEIAALVDKCVDKAKQSHEFSFDLTAKSVTELEGTGKVDFSGKEFEWGQRTILSPKRMTPGDPFGWWKLTNGEYILRLNEAINLPPNCVGIILPLDRITQNGAHHAPLVVTKSTPFVEILLQVGHVGIEIKENARISAMTIYQLG